MRVYFSQGIFGSETCLFFQALDTAFKDQRASLSSQDFIALVSAFFVDFALETSRATSSS
jgi:hypothetical protein